MAANPREGQMPSDLSADRPGADPSSDRLGYAPFAKRLAQSIVKASPPEGHVIALYGSWGSGKTTMLNYVRHYLNGAEPSEHPIVVAFNPWWFSGSEDLIWAFLNQLQASLKGHKGFSWWTRFRMRRRLTTFAELLSEAPASWAKIVARLLLPNADIAKLKDKISGALQKSGRPVLAVLDDIDRLTSVEIGQIFRVVKAIADFPHLTYLMAFDKSVVARALSESQSGAGADYLEKIVQTAFELPLVDRLSIRNLFFERLNSILTGVREKDFDNTYWGNIFLEGIDKFLETPRDVVRFTNTLAVTFPAVIGEVNPVDFIAVEALRMFCPDVYETIRNNRAMFTGHAPDNLRRPGRDELVQFHNGWLERTRKTSPLVEEPIRSMLQRLFPKLQGVWGKTQFGPDWEGDWRRKLRVCSDSVFAVYFSLAIPTGEISNAEMQAILANGGSAERFGSDILKLAEQIRPDGKTRAAAFLVRLQDYTETEIGLEQIQPIVSALLDIGDLVMRPEDASSGLFDLGVDVQSGRVIWQLLKRVEPPRRFEILRQAFERGRALFLIQKSFIVLGQQQGLYGEHARPEEEWFVTRDQLLELERVLVERIRRASQNGSLLNTPRLLLVLSFWGEKGGQAEAHAWVADTVRDDRKLAELLERCLASTSSVGLGDAVGRKNDRLDPNWLKPYVDVDQLATRVKDLSKSDALSDRQRRGVNQFLKEYEFRKQGGNPDDPFAQGRIA